jgi:hypothetical protein
MNEKVWNAELPGNSKKKPQDWPVAWRSANVHAHGILGWRSGVRRRKSLAVVFMAMILKCFAQRVKSFVVLLSDKLSRRQISFGRE